MKNSKVKDFNVTIAELFQTWKLVVQLLLSKILNAKFRKAAQNFEKENQFSIITFLGNCVFSTFFAFFSFDDSVLAPRLPNPWCCCYHGLQTEYSGSTGKGRINVTEVYFFRKACYYVTEAHTLGQTARVVEAIGSGLGVAGKARDVAPGCQHCHT